MPTEQLSTIATQSIIITSMETSLSALVWKPVYTERKTAPRKAFTMTKPIECKAVITKPRSNQSMCSAECRTKHERRKAQRNYKEITTKKCKSCDCDFECNHPDQQFCGKDCRIFFNNLLKTLGKPLYEGMFTWRVGREKGSWTQATQAFSAARQKINDACEEYKNKKASEL